MHEPYVKPLPVRFRSLKMLRFSHLCAARLILITLVTIYRNKNFLLSSHDLNYFSSIQ